MKKLIFILIYCLLVGCTKVTNLKVHAKNPLCIKPLIGYNYLTCKEFHFTINNKEFIIPANFNTDLASIPKIAWPIMAPAHSSLIRPAIVHDWLYRQTCHFTRLQTDLIFYRMLKSEGISTVKATSMFYAVRIFGWNYYNEDFCDEGIKILDKAPRGLQIASLQRFNRETYHRVGA